LKVHKKTGRKNAKRDGGREREMKKGREEIFYIILRTDLGCLS
jgi:hypothetical protein